jgi:hypothetical protein
MMSDIGGLLRHLCNSSFDEDKTFDLRGGEPGIDCDHLKHVENNSADQT